MPLILALTPDEVTLWTIIVGVGAVVIAVVIILLTFLARVVREIDFGVAAVLEAAGGVVANTVNLEALETTLAGCEAIREEVTRHDELLGSLL